MRWERPWLSAFWGSKRQSSISILLIGYWREHNWGKKRNWGRKWSARSISFLILLSFQPNMTKVMNQGEFFLSYQKEHPYHVVCLFCLFFSHWIFISLNHVYFYKFIYCLSSFTKTEVYYLKCPPYLEQHLNLRMGCTKLLILEWLTLTIRTKEEAGNKRLDPYSPTCLPQSKMAGESLSW